MNTQTPEYPEHEKLAALDGANNTVGRFLEWLEEEGIVLCKWHDDDKIHPHYETKEDMIARHFDIDPNKLESEKQAMLDSIRGGI